MSEENLEGLIPVELSEFVHDGDVNIEKLYQVLDNVQAAWQKRLDIETERNKNGDWQGLLGKRIQWPVTELNQLLA